MMPWVIKMKYRLRELRKEAGLSQKQVAQYLACSQSAYSRYEREKSILYTKDAVKLADLYHVSLDYLAGLTVRRDPYPRSRRK